MLQDRYPFIKQPIQIPQARDPGVVVMPDGRAIHVSYWDEDPIYDTVTLDTSISAGTGYVFFRDLQGKNLDKTNMATSSRLPEGWQMYVWYIAFLPTPQVTQADWQTIASKGYFELQVNQRKRRTGPIWTTQSTATSYGFPSLFTKPLDFPILLTDKMTFQATLTFYEAVTLSAESDVVCMLWGWINRPVGA